LVYFFMGCAGIFPPLMILWIIAIVVNYIGSFLLLLYMNWYACQCIRDSAAGQIRAAETTAITPGLGEIFGETFRAVACVLLCVAPAIVYRLTGHGADAVFWTLLGVGGFFLPMALLAVTMFESTAGLNPMLVVGSVFSTLVPYCLLVPFCYSLILLFPFALYSMKVIGLPGYALLFATYYLWMILAHLLGRFYWKYEERLNWAA
jgi:hypothetical protein